MVFPALSLRSSQHVKDRKLVSADATSSSQLFWTNSLSHGFQKAARHRFQAFNVVKRLPIEHG